VRGQFTATVFGRKEVLIPLGSMQYFETVKGKMLVIPLSANRTLKPSIVDIKIIEKIGIVLQQV
jgi:hypothetical protein